MVKNVKARKKNQIKEKKPKRKPKHNPLKADNINDLKSELDRISELNRNGPSSSMKNKMKRRELVLMRNSTKNKIKAKLRRKKQAMREELGDESVPSQTPKTIETLREKDDTFVDRENDEEIKEEMKNDEFSSYFNKEYDPQILLTTSIKHTGEIFKFMREMKETLPNSYFYYRKKHNLKDIIELAKGKGFSDVIVVYERLRKPYSMVISHLPDGPTVEFKIFNVVYHDQIEGAARSNNHSPELIFKNFNTKLGFRLNRILNSLFPHSTDIEGRQVATFHNQRDYVFFRHHRFIFDDDFTKVNLQEIGPRFCLRLLSIQKGTFDNTTGEYEFYYKNKMGVRRRKFNL
jgi:ribosome production factor 1